jgi:hypothetical protein
MPGHGLLGRGGPIDANILDFSGAFDLVPNVLLLTKMAALGVESRVVV